jgi:hypothetical protein
MVTNPFLFHDPATDAVAQKNYMFSNRTTVDAVVKRGDIVKLCHAHAQVSGNVRQGLVGYPSYTVLDDFKRVNGRVAFLGKRGQDLVDGLHLIFCQH